IKSNLAAYEAERASAYRQVRWRVPLFIGLVLVFVALVAWVFNRIADPYEQWLSTPHVLLYVVGLVAAILLYFQAIKPASRLQHRKTLLPIIFGFIRDMRYEHEVTPNSFDRLPRETIGTFNTKRFDDIVSGRYEGFPFVLYEADLRQGTGGTIAFKGIVVAFE
ncbi:MAG: hypothetical protein E5Y18_16955, partial [Mesorhizobium sp.]